MFAIKIIIDVNIGAEHLVILEPDAIASLSFGAHNL